MSPDNDASFGSPDAEHPNYRHIALLVSVVAALAIVAWAASLFFGVRAQGFAQTTVTPTKTVAPPIGDARPAVVGPQAALPTFTPVPTNTPIPLPSSVDSSTSAKSAGIRPEPWVEEIAVIRGLNPDGDYIIVDQNNQTMYVVDDGYLARQLHITTGDPDSGWDTPAWFGVVGDYWGTFQGRGGVLADEGWWLFERAGGNFLIHSLPYTLDASGDKHFKGERDLGASPASNGCIRLSPEDAAWFSAWNPAGKPIIILPYTGLHANQG
ncbi:MAG: L,D-transpeptidase [Caldilineales bacterium]|nr:L,D-transpeptidase [Caldilineales bacterium]